MEKREPKTPEELRRRVYIPEDSLVRSVIEKTAQAVAKYGTVIEKVPFFLKIGFI